MEKSLNKKHAGSWMHYFDAIILAVLLLIGGNNINSGPNHNLITNCKSSH
jgi:hypothetical protein